MPLHLEWRAWAKMAGGYKDNGDGSGDELAVAFEWLRWPAAGRSVRGLEREIVLEFVGIDLVITRNNVARNQVDVANVTWDNTVAAYAQSYANQRVGDCSLVHSNGAYGENLAKGTGTFTGTYARARLLALCSDSLARVYLSRVRQSFKCNNGWWYVVCNYDPPGNYEGELPY
ncbi:SCP domain-containing protein [Psidium guajava]|nr:SCP domain-containing protein [Psidium guajava]